MTPETFQRAFGGQDRVDWMRWQPSVVSLRTPCVSAHVRGGGTSYRADACWTVPMTYHEHAEMHRVGQETYAREHDLDLERLAIATEAQWQAHVRAAIPLPW